MREFFDEALARSAQIPGVLAAAFADILPPADFGGLQTFSREDRPLPEPGHRGDNMLLRSVSDDYFRVMRIRW
jgi:hypothetical protein